MGQFPKPIILKQRMGGVLAKLAVAFPLGFVEELILTIPALGPVVVFDLIIGKKSIDAPESIAVFGTELSG